MSEPVRVSANRCSPPTVAILGLGGCGINLTRAILNRQVTAGGRETAVRHQLDFYNYLDTSRANIRDGERLSLISEGHGSGKVRTTNSDEIRRNIPMLSDTAIGDTDIVIVVFGCSGGTGGAIAPLLIQELIRRNKVVVAVGSAETTSLIDCKNTKGCLKTLNFLVERDDIYLPTILTETTTDRTEADKYLVGQTTGLIQLLTQDVIEIDRNDRIHWLNAGKTVSVQGGLHPLYVFGPDFSEAQDVEDVNNPTVAADSSLYIGAEHADGSRRYEKSPVILERFRKDGVYDLTNEIVPSPITGVVMSTSKTLETIIDNIEAKETMFSNQHTRMSDKVSKKLSASADDADIIL